MSAEGDGGSQSYGAMTDQFRMKNMEIETIIRNSNKEDFELQVDPHTIAMNTRADSLAASPPHALKQENGEDNEE